MKTFKLLRNLTIPCLLLLVWQLWGASQPVQGGAPIPTHIIASAREMIASGELPGALSLSLLRILIGFLIASVLAIGVGILIGYFRVAERLLDPIVESFRPIAPIALIPLAILWFGTGTPAAVFIVAYAAFFPLAVNTIDGVKQVNPRLIQAASTMGLSQLRILQTVILPGALPSIFVGLRLAMGIAWASIIAAELAAGSAAGGAGASGIGQLMFILYSYSVELNGIVVCMVAIGLIALLIDHGLRFLQRRLMPWAV